MLDDARRAHRKARSPHQARGDAQERRAECSVDSLIDARGRATRTSFDGAAAPHRADLHDGPAAAHASAYALEKG